MNKKYGVWGLGVVGASVLSFLHKHAQELGVGSLTVMDARTPSAEEQNFLNALHVQFCPQSDRLSFFNTCDAIVPSPGIDIEQMSSFKHKMVEEVDLFFSTWPRKTIAVTGTVGKTSVVHMLSRVLEHNNVHLVTGGNSWNGMLNLVDNTTDYALLELSSFQLERASSIAPYSQLSQTYILIILIGIKRLSSIPWQNTTY